MISGFVVIRNDKGLHLKPTGYLCKEALNFESHITIRIRDKEVNAKSVLGVLSACIKSGDEIELICEGTDEQLALSTLIKEVEKGLGEQINEK